MGEGQIYTFRLGKYAIDILLPVRYFKTSDYTTMWEVTLDTSLYIHKKIDGGVRTVKISLLGFGTRVRNLKVFQVVN